MSRARCGQCLALGDGQCLHTRDAGCLERRGVVRRVFPGGRRRALSAHVPFTQRWRKRVAGKANDKRRAGTGEPWAATTRASKSEIAAMRRTTTRGMMPRPFVSKREIVNATQAKNETQMIAATGRVKAAGAVTPKGTSKRTSGHMLWNSARFSCLATYVRPMTYARSRAEARTTGGSSRPATASAAVK